MVTMRTDYDYDQKSLQYGVWGLTMGVLFFVPTLLCWRSGRHIFLDKICISQTHEGKKLDGVVGIGAFLNASDCLLVLLDSTYVTRLWCVFELAAFSKLMERHRNKVVRIKPLPHAPVFIVLFVYWTGWYAFDILFDYNPKMYPLMFVVLSVCIWPSCCVLRRYRDLLANLEAQLGEFSLCASNCYCCSVRHVHPDTGEGLLCDREVVQACVDNWFGSCNAFDTFVQHNLFEKFSEGIGQTGMPFRLVLTMHLPLLWAHFDKVAARIKVQAWDLTLFMSVFTAFNFVIAMPFGIGCLSALAYGARRRLSSPFADALLSLGLGFALVGIFFSQTLLWSLHAGHWKVATMAVHIAVMGILTSWMYGGCAFCRLFGSLFRSQRQPRLGDQPGVTLDAGGGGTHADVRVVGRESDQLDEAVECESTISI
eukprot:TRINITY_DN6388_c0_g2_i5.p1 TRINITY_DN6388_c0_g2~~TRINITY_DN6388_c0_g2_i5.p1  ORF type:complete len:458 (-),score=34.14 TRINITY_DN6388_c0_g2_i5:30-1304(-)